MDFHRYACNLLFVYIMSLGNFPLNPYIPGPPFGNLFYLADFSLESIIRMVHSVGINMYEGRSYGFHVSIFKDIWYHSADYDASVGWWAVKLI